MDISFLVMTVSIVTLCVVITLLAAANMSSRKLDARIGRERQESVEQRLTGLARSNDVLTVSVAELKAAVESILARLH